MAEITAIYPTATAENMIAAVVSYTKTRDDCYTQLRRLQPAGVALAQTELLLYDKAVRVMCELATDLGEIKYGRTRTRYYATIHSRAVAVQAATADINRQLANTK